MVSVMNLFKAIILVQLFYAVSITMMAHSIAGTNEDLSQSFRGYDSTLELQNVSTSIEEGLRKQTNIPVVEIGALVFYSGNILLDLLLNFAFAIPQMLGMLMHGLMLIFGFDTFLWQQVQLFASVLVMSIYFISLLNLIVGIRSGRVV